MQQNKQPDLFDCLLEQELKTDNNTCSYEQRQTNVNQGEELFEKYMTEKGYPFQRFGFDEKKNNINGFFLMHPLLRSLPDYTSYFKDQNKLIYWHVKGTNKIKVEDLIQYTNFESLFCEKQSIMRIAFCFINQTPIIKSLTEVKEMITGLTIKEWHDKKQFISLTLS
jgi:hypothetical protein